MRQLPRREQLARQRQRAAQQRAAARATELGFENLRAYLVDRLVIHAWTLAEVVGELGAAPATLRRLLDEQQVRRVAPTRRQRAAAAAASGPKQQARAVQRRQARLAQLGFAGLEEYLKDRRVGRGWSVRRLGAELQVGHEWLIRQLTPLGCATDQQQTTPAILQAAPPAPRGSPPIPAQSRSSAVICTNSLPTASPVTRRPRPFWPVPHGLASGGGKVEGKSRRVRPHSAPCCGQRKWPSRGPD